MTATVERVEGTRVFIRMEGEGERIEMVYDAAAGMTTEFREKALQLAFRVTGHGSVRPNALDLSRRLAASSVPADTIKAATARVLAMLAEADHAWAAYEAAATGAERHSAITIKITSDTGGNTWTVSAHYGATGRTAPRASASDGGSHPMYHLARTEAEDRAKAYARGHAVTRA